MIKSCPHCDQKLRIPDERGRIQVKCPRCNHVFHYEPLAVDPSLESKKTNQAKQENEIKLGDEFGLQGLAESILEFSDIETERIIHAIREGSKVARGVIWLPFYKFRINRKRSQIFVELIAYYEFLILVHLASLRRLSNGELGEVQHQIERQMVLATEPNRKLRKLITDSLCGELSPNITILTGSYIRDDETLTDLSGAELTRISKILSFNLSDFILKSYIVSFVRLLKTLGHSGHHFFSSSDWHFLWIAHANCINSARSLIKDSFNRTTPVRESETHGRGEYSLEEKHGSRFVPIITGIAEIGIGIVIAGVGKGIIRYLTMVIGGGLFLLGLKALLFGLFARQTKVDEMTLTKRP